MNTIDAPRIENFLPILSARYPDASAPIKHEIVLELCYCASCFNCTVPKKHPAKSEDTIDPSFADPEGNFSRKYDIVRIPDKTPDNIS